MVAGDQRIHQLWSMRVSFSSDRTVTVPIPAIFQRWVTGSRAEFPFWVSWPPTKLTFAGLRLRTAAALAAMKSAGGLTTTARMPDQLCRAQSAR